MSGYLYGLRERESGAASFYKKQIAKILTDYYIVIASVILLQLLLKKDVISTSRIGKSLLTAGTLKGGEHLWFILYILLCYLLVPLYEKYFRKLFKRADRNIIRGGG